MRRKAAPALAGALRAELRGHHPHPSAERPLLPTAALPPGPAPYLGCSQAGSAPGPMGRRHRILQRRPERSTRRGAREGWLGGRARKGRGLSALSNLPEKKKKRLRSCNGHQKKTKFVKFLRRREPAALRLPAGLRLGWPGGDPKTP